jgi:hypothetical protein
MKVVRIPWGIEWAIELNELVDTEYGQCIFRDRFDIVPKVGETFLLVDKVGAVWKSTVLYYKTIGIDDRSSVYTTKQVEYLGSEDDVLPLMLAAEGK